MQYVPPLGIQTFHYFINWLSALFIGKGKSHHGKLGTYMKYSPIFSKNIEQLIVIT